MNGIFVLNITGTNFIIYLQVNVILDKYKLNSYKHVISTYNLFFLYGNARVMKEN